MKKIYLILLLLISSLTLSACDKADYIPEKFGEWEGSYIYMGVRRVKTTGEDLEYLFTTFTKDDIEYDIDAYGTYQYKGDDLYVGIRYNDDQHAIVKYNLESKELSAIYHYGTLYSYETYGVYQVLDESILISKDTTLIRIAYDGTVINYNFAYFKSYKSDPSGIYTYKKNNFELFFTKESLDFNEVLVINMHNQSFDGIISSYQIIEPFIYIRTIKTSETNSELNRPTALYAYHIENQTLHVLFEPDGDQGVKVLSNHHFITYDITQIDHDDKTSSHNINNKLYQVNDDGSAELKFTFRADKDYTYFEYQKDNVQNIIANAYYKRYGLFGDLIQKHENYTFDFNTYQLSGGRIYEDVSSVPKGIETDDYIYHWTFRRFGVFFGTTFYYFERYDKSTEESTVMFYYTEHGEDTNIDDEDFLYYLQNRFYSSTTFNLVRPY